MIQPQNNFLPERILPKAYQKKSTAGIIACWKASSFHSQPKSWIIIAASQISAQSAKPVKPITNMTLYWYGPHWILSTTSFTSYSFSPAFVLEEEGSPVSSYFSYIILSWLDGWVTFFIKLSNYLSTITKTARPHEKLSQSQRSQ